MDPPARGAPGTVLARLPAPDAAHLRDLPPVPSGSPPVTVTLGSRALLVAGPGLRRAGYLPAGVHAGARLADGTPAVDILVPAPTRTAHPDWWEALRSRAARVFHLAHGPVLSVLAPELALHRRARSC